MVVLYGSDDDNTLKALSWLQENGVTQIDCRDVTLPPYNSKKWLLPTVEAPQGRLEGFSEDAYQSFFLK